MAGWDTGKPRGSRRFYVYDVDEKRFWLKAKTLRAAIAECEAGDNVRLGQIVDIFRHPDDYEPVAESVDVLG